MAIPVSNVTTVDHIDCHLCVDCVVKCPEKGALTINKRKLTWLPALATVVLSAAATTIATSYELPTISENWGKTEGKNIQVVRMDGLKNIKCFGSSRSFANHMKEVPGVTGIETFVKHNRVVVYYDASQTDTEKVKKAIFTPLSELLNFHGQTSGDVSYLKTGIDRCFDPNDQSYLAEMLRQENGVLALTTTFGEPVQATIYYDKTLTDINKIKAAVSKPTLILGEGKDQTTVKTGFVINEKGENIGTIPAYEFAAMFIPTTDVTFNKFETYSIDKLMVYELPFSEGADPGMQKWIPYLVSHASNDDGVVRMQTEFTKEGPVIKIWFVDKLTSVEKINSLLKATEFVVHYPDKSTKKVKNPFRFPV